MQTIYQLDASNVATGKSKTIDDCDPCPPGWTRVDCAPVPAGKFGQVVAGGLAIFDAYPEPPAPPVPGTITARQGKIILSRHGLLAAVQAGIDAIPGQEGEEARIEFADAKEWDRSWPTLISVSQALGLSPEQVDQMFIDAASI